LMALTAILIKFHWVLLQFSYLSDRQHNKVVKSVDSGARLQWSESWLSHLQTLWVLASYLASLWLGFLIHEMGIIIMLSHGMTKWKKIFQHCLKHSNVSYKC
jgi:hypothetical protein